MSVNEKMTAIADAIRERTGETEPLTLDDMAENIPNVYKSGYEQGFSEGESAGEADGYIKGNEEGYKSGYEQGKQAQYDEFWDAYQDDGDRTDYQYAFARWRSGAFRPKYDIKPGGSIAMMFAYSKLTNVAQMLEDCGVVLDTSGVTSFNDFASYSNTLTRLPEISTIGASSLNGIFYNCAVLATIDKLIFKSDGSQTWATTAFQGLPSLKNIVIEGKIGASLSLANSSKLTYVSLISIINALYDYSDTDATKTLTLHATAKAKLSDSDIAIATEKGWTIA